MDATNFLETFEAQYNKDDNSWWMFDSGQHQVLFDTAIAQRDEARAEVERLRKEVSGAVHAGINGATRAYQDRIDEAALMQKVAEIDRDAAIAEVARLRTAAENVRRNLELHADDWQDSYRLAAIAVLSDALEE